MYQGDSSKRADPPREQSAIVRRCDRQLRANAFVRQVDEIAARQGCNLPVPLLMAMVRLFGEALEWQRDATASAGAGMNSPAAARSTTRRLCRGRAAFVGEGTPVHILRPVVSGGATRRQPTSTTVDRLNFCVSPGAAQLPLTAGSASITGVTDRPQRCVATATWRKRPCLSRRPAQAWLIDQLRSSQ